MQETSIDWILQQLKKQKEIINIQSQEIQLVMIDDIFEQAKNIHKQELINAFILGHVSDKTQYEKILKSFLKK